MSRPSSFGYLTARASEGDDNDEQIPLCRIEYLGDDEDRGFAICDPRYRDLHKRGRSAPEGPGQWQLTPPAES
jgi:hypothetical protein